MLDFVESQDVNRWLIISNCNCRSDKYITNLDYYSFKNTVNYFLSSKVIQLEDSKKDKYLDQLEYDRTSILRDFKVLEKIRT